MTDPDPSKTLEELARESGKFPVDAFHFVQEGLRFTVQKLHQDGQGDTHISGRDLCWGLRDFALKRWGLLAPLVLHRWNIHNTMDFGEIVFRMVEAGCLAKKDDDDIRDFQGVYEFKAAFDPKLVIDLDKKEASGTEE